LYASDDFISFLCFDNVDGTSEVVYSLLKQASPFISRHIYALFRMFIGAVNKTS